MRFTIDTSGFAEPLREVARAAVREESRIVQAVRRGALEVQGEAVRSIQNSPGTGRVRASGDRASSPGNPPRTDTGRLVQSIRVEPREDGADVVAATEYALHLEYGTRKMAPRPFMEPAREARQEDIERMVREELRRMWEE